MALVKEALLGCLGASAHFWMQYPNALKSMPQKQRYAFWDHLEAVAGASKIARQQAFEGAIATFVFAADDEVAERAYYTALHLASLYGDLDTSPVKALTGEDWAEWSGGNQVGRYVDLARRGLQRADSRTLPEGEVDLPDEGSLAFPQSQDTLRQEPIFLPDLLE